LTETRDFSNPVTQSKSVYHASAYNAQTGKRRIKTIFDQFRNKHARYTRAKCAMEQIERHMSCAKQLGAMFS
jgi:hypothetical protein